MKLHRTYSSKECSNKADQHWELAELARQDRDTYAEYRHTRLAKKWTELVRQGGYTPEENNNV